MDELHIFQKWNDEGRGGRGGGDKRNLHRRPYSIERRLTEAMKRGNAKAGGTVNGAIDPDLSARMYVFRTRSSVAALTNQLAAEPFPSSSERIVARKFRLQLATKSPLGIINRLINSQERVAAFSATFTIIMEQPRSLRLAGVSGNVTEA